MAGCRRWGCASREAAYGQLAAPAGWRAGDRLIRGQLAAVSRWSPAWSLSREWAPGSQGPDHAHRRARRGHPARPIVTTTSAAATWPAAPLVTGRDPAI